MEQQAAGSRQQAASRNGDSCQPPPADCQLSLDWTLDPLEARVLCTLSAHRGRGAAISLLELSRSVWTAPRMVQYAIHRLRVEHGSPIASAAGKPAGYYLAETADEVEACYREHRAKALSTLAAMAALRRINLQELLGQLALEVAS